MTDRFLVTDRNAMKHAQRCDLALSRLRAALAPIMGMVCEASLRGSFGLAQVGARADVWQALAAAFADAEPWPLELLGPIGRVLLRQPTPERPTYLEETIPVLFSRGHHDHVAFTAHARSAARGAGLPRPMVTEAPLGTVMTQEWWRQDGATWRPCGLYEPDAVPVTVWAVPAWEGHPPAFQQVVGGGL